MKSCPYLFSIGLMLVGSVIFLSCGESSNTPDNPMIIGAEGGSFTYDDGKLSVEVPAGALSQDVTFTVAKRATTRIAPPNTMVYDIGPTGTTFAKPVKVTIKKDPQALAKITVPSAVISDNNNQNKWVKIQNVIKETSTSTISFSINHLSEIREPGGSDACLSLLCLMNADCAEGCTCFNCGQVLDTTNNSSIGECAASQYQCPS